MGHPDEMKGRAKEAVGDLTDNDRLKREGKKDQMEGKAKELIDDARDKLRSDDDS